MEKLTKLRDRIDWLDAQIASLLNERMRAADQVGKIKRNHQWIVTDQSREQNVLNQVKEIVQHPVLKANIANIYREIMQESRIAQQFFQHLSLPFRRIAIIGLGLIGGSICKALKMKDPSIEIATIVHPSEDLSLAQEGGWIDVQYTAMEELMQHVELIILTSPLSTIVSWAEEIKRSSRENDKLLVIDLASVKGEIVNTFEKLSCHQIEFIGTHPMAGKEKKGFANTQATLFVNRPWVIVAHSKNSSEGLDSIKQLIRFLGSDPIVLEAIDHDRKAALVSHIPSILSKLYYDFVNVVDPESIQISGPGFQAFTRLAHDNQEMRNEIAKANNFFIEAYLEEWLMYLQNRGSL